MNVEATRPSFKFNSDGTPQLVRSILYNFERFSYGMSIRPAKQPRRGIFQMSFFGDPACVHLNGVAGFNLKYLRITEPGK
jgi:hypothetical protein